MHNAMKPANFCFHSRSGVKAFGVPTSVGICFATAKCRRLNRQRTIPWPVLLFACSAHAGELVQPAGEPYRVELFPEPREQKLSDIGMHVQGTLCDGLFRAVNVADYGREAMNVNAFDEVPDSEWFVNRIERHDLSPAQVARGPNRRSGPDTRGPWTVLSAKTEGVTPGLLIQDSLGDRYFLKLDRVEHPELWTAAEIIGTRIIWAAGYHTPENFLVWFDEGTLQLGEKMRMTPAELSELLGRAARAPDGRLRAVASRFLPGKPKGPYLFAGTRADDPNDVIDHRHRRELRGLTVFFALINNTDWKEINTLDMFVSEGKRGYVKHHLIDFNQSLGAGSFGVKELWGGHEYYVDFKAIGWSHLTFGLRDRASERAKPSPYRSVGNFESEAFDGRHWHPWRPVAPFLYFTGRDGFWAAKIVSCFSDDHLAAIMHEAKYSDPAAERYVLKTLIARRDKIVRWWFRRYSPLRRIREHDGSIAFEDLLVRAEGAAAEAQYRYRFDGGPWTEARTPQMPLPNQEEVHLQIQARYANGDWQRVIGIKLKRAQGRQLQVTRIER